MNSHPSPTRRTRTKGFSLVELLVVMAIIGILTALAIPAFNAIGRAGGVTKAGGDIAGILELSRAHAMANNTPVWVGFTSLPDDEDILVVGVVTSRNGESNPANSDLVPISRPQRFQNIQLVSVPADSDVRPVVDANDQLAAIENSPFTFSIPAGGETIDFDSHVIRFNSRGEARTGDRLRKIIELGLQDSAEGIIRNPDNFAVVQVGGLSGSVTLYRP